MNMSTLYNKSLQHVCRLTILSDHEGECKDWEGEVEIP